MAAPAPCVILAVSPRGLALAERLRAALPADLIVPDRLADQGGLARGRVQTYQAGAIREAVATAFASYRGIVFILPVGAAVRLIAPHVGDKHADPGVVALDEAGAYAVALLSGHVGGGNALAQAVGDALGARPIVTTAAEALDLLALDLLGQAWGWTIESETDLTRASAVLLEGDAVGCFQDAGEETWWSQAPANLERFGTLQELVTAPLAARLVITDRVLTAPLPAPCVVYRPRSLAAGVGCVRGAAMPEIRTLLTDTLRRHGLALASVRVLATIDRKSDEPGIRELADTNEWELRTFTAAELTRMGAPSGASSAVQDAVGAPGVCEPAALLAAHADVLLVPKTRTPRVTIAVARIPFDTPQPRDNLETDTAGIPSPPLVERQSKTGSGAPVVPSPPLGERARVRGISFSSANTDLATIAPSPPPSPPMGERETRTNDRPLLGERGTRTNDRPLREQAESGAPLGGLFLVGIGPGGPEGLTARARAVLEAVDVVVGYDGYLDLLQPWLKGPDFRGSPIGDEVARARLAIDLARGGQRVALVSSGDAGVYGTAGIVFELLDETHAAADAAAVEVVPGVSAAHAAAALLGAPLMNDYAALSLSDLMTPWEVIERRLQAVAAADLVVALYNPRSGRRRDQLVQAQAIFLAHRAPETPVGIVRNAGRAGQSVRIVTLEELLDQDVDMLTIVIVGNAATVRVGDRMVTRRGYLTQP